MGGPAPASNQIGIDGDADDPFWATTATALVAASKQPKMTRRTHRARFMPLSPNLNEPTRPKASTGLYWRCNTPGNPGPLMGQTLNAEDNRSPRNWAGRTHSLRTRPGALGVRLGIR